jgi:hypothetical protein
MGYSGEKKTKLLALKKHIKRNFEDSDYKILKNSEYNEFFKEESKKNKGAGVHTFKSNFPDPANMLIVNGKTHLIVMPDAFRSLCLMINTDKGKYIKQYYIALEKLIQAYFIYQSTFKGMCYKKELFELKNLHHIKTYTLTQNKIRLNDEINNHNKLGFVYYIQEELTKNVKIGYTYNLPNRLISLQVGNSQKLTIVRTINCKNPYATEQKLHKENKKYHIHGEWYMNNVLQ